MTDRSSKLKLGGFVAAGAATLTGIAVLFGGAPRLFDDRASYTVSFAEAPNVAVGVPVRKSGVPIGQVTAVDIDEQTGLVKVQIRVGRKYLPRTTEEPQLARSLLSGDTSIDFVPKVGADNQPIISRGDTIDPGTDITGITPVNTNRLVAQASGALPAAEQSMARMLASMERLEKAVPKIEKAFDEVGSLARAGREFLPELRKTNDKVQDVLAFNDQPPPGEEPQGLKATLTELREFLKTARPLIEDVRRIVKANEADVNATVKNLRQTTEAVNDIFNQDNRKALSGLIKNLESASDDLTKTVRLAALVLDQGEKTLKEINQRLAQAGATLKAAEGAFKNVEAATKPLAESAGPMLQNVMIAADQLAKTLAEARVTLATINRADGTLQKVIADPALYNHLTAAAVNLERTLVRAEKVAADLQVFADKVARRPEVIGVGGAVRPSAGLKESPGAALPVQPLPPVRESERR